MLNSSLSYLLLCVVLVSEKAGMVEPSFPKGLRVLAVDDDKAFLLMLEKMLLACMYQVTICDGGEDALSIIRGDKNRFDLILCDLYMPDMDGLELLRNIASETDIPVVMMSHDGTPEAVMKSVVYGACDFLVKPISIEQIGVVWHHVLRRRQNNQSENVREREQVESDKPKPVEDEEEEEEEEHHHEHEHGTNKAKKPRIIWTQELHQKFIQAVNQLGVDKAVPKKILECMQQMGVTELTRENVASHLQKFRLYVRRRNGESIEHSGNSSMFVGLEQVQVQGHPYGNVQFQYGNNNIAMPLHEQRKLVDPMMTTTHYHHRFGANNMLATLPRPMHDHYLQHINYDQVYALNGNLFPPLTKHEGLGGGVLHRTDSDPQVHLYAYDQDNPSFNQALP